MDRERGQRFVREPPPSAWDSKQVCSPRATSSSATVTPPAWAFPLHALPSQPVPSIPPVCSTLPGAGAIKSSTARPIVSRRAVSPHGESSAVSRVSVQPNGEVSCQMRHSASSSSSLRMSSPVSVSRVLTRGASYPALVDDGMLVGARHVRQVIEEVAASGHAAAPPLQHGLRAMSPARVLSPARSPRSLPFKGVQALSSRRASPGPSRIASTSPRMASPPALSRGMPGNVMGRNIDLPGRQQQAVATPRKAGATEWRSQLSHYMELPHRSIATVSVSHNLDDKTLDTKPVLLAPPTTPPRVASGGSIASLSATQAPSNYPTDAPSYGSLCSEAAGDTGATVGDGSGCIDCMDSPWSAQTRGSLTPPVVDDWDGTWGPSTDFLRQKCVMADRGTSSPPMVSEIPAGTGGVTENSVDVHAVRRDCSAVGVPPALQKPAATGGHIVVANPNAGNGRATTSGTRRTVPLRHSRLSAGRVGKDEHCGLFHGERLCKAASTSDLFAPPNQLIVPQLKSAASAVSLSMPPQPTASATACPHTEANGDLTFCRLHTTVETMKTSEQGSSLLDESHQISDVSTLLGNSEEELTSNSTMTAAGDDSRLRILEIQQAEMLHKSNSKLKQQLWEAEQERDLYRARWNEVSQRFAEAGRESLRLSRLARAAEQKKHEFELENGVLIGKLEDSRLKLQEVASEKETLVQQLKEAASERETLVLQLKERFRVAEASRSRDRKQPREVERRLRQHGRDDACNGDLNNYAAAVLAPPEASPRVLVLGATGLLGREVMKALDEAWEVRGIGLSRAEPPCVACDLTSSGTALSQIQAFQPHVVINLVGERRTEVFEDDPAKAQFLNVETAGAVAKACERHGAWLIYISTDQVFDGTAPPYEPESQSNPLNEFGRQKLQGEKMTLDASMQAAVVRVSQMYGPVQFLEESDVTSLYAELCSGCKRKADDWQLHYPTWTSDVAWVLRSMVDLHCNGTILRGVFHWKSSEQFTQFEMIRTMAELFAFDIAGITPETVPLEALQRPQDSQLDGTRLDKIIGKRPYTTFRQGLQQCLGPFLKAQQVQMEVAVVEPLKEVQ